MKLKDQNLGLTQATSRPEIEKKKKTMKHLSRAKNQEEKQGKTRSKAKNKEVCLSTLIFLAITKVNPWTLNVFLWGLMLVLHAIISYDKVYEGFRHDKHDYGMKQG